MAAGKFATGHSFTRLKTPKLTKTLAYELSLVQISPVPKHADLSERVLSLNQGNSYKVAIGRASGSNATRKEEAGNALFDIRGVSKVHAHIYVEDRKVYYRDHQSRNGTKFTDPQSLTVDAGEKTVLLADLSKEMSPEGMPLGTFHLSPKLCFAQSLKLEGKIKLAPASFGAQTSTTKEVKNEVKELGFDDTAGPAVDSEPNDDASVYAYASDDSELDKGLVFMFSEPSDDESEFAGLSSEDDEDINSEVNYDSGFAKFVVGRAEDEDEYDKEDEVDEEFETEEQILEELKREDQTKGQQEPKPLIDIVVEETARDDSEAAVEIEAPSYVATLMVQEHLKRLDKEANASTEDIGPRVEKAAVDVGAQESKSTLLKRKRSDDEEEVPAVTVSSAQPDVKEETAVAVANTQSGVKEEIPIAVTANANAKEEPVPQPPAHEPPAKRLRKTFAQYKAFALGAAAGSVMTIAALLASAPDDI